MVILPTDLDRVMESAWQKTNRVPGHLGENEARFLGLLAAATPGKGVILEIGSFKGKSTVMLASVAAHYGVYKLARSRVPRSPISPAEWVALIS